VRPVDNDWIYGRMSFGGEIPMNEQDMTVTYPKVYALFQGLPVSTACILCEIVVV